MGITTNLSVEGGASLSSDVAASRRSYQPTTQETIPQETIPQETNNNNAHALNERTKAINKINSLLKEIEQAKENSIYRRNSINSRFATGEINARIRDKLLSQTNPDNRIEGINANIERQQRKVSAANKSLNTGQDYNDTLKNIKDSSGTSTKATLAYKASRGDTDAAKTLANKLYNESKARFSTRIRGTTDYNPVGKTAGVYKSPLTGKPVIVRQTTPNLVRYSRKQANNVWSRDYKVTATIEDSNYKKTVSTPNSLNKTTSSGELGGVTEKTISNLVSRKQQQPRTVTLTIPESSLAAEKTTSFDKVTQQPTNTGIRTTSFKNIPSYKGEVKEIKDIPLLISSKGYTPKKESSFRIGPIVLTTEGADVLSYKGNKDLSQAKTAFKKKEFVPAAGLFIGGVSKKFASGSRSFYSGLVKEPATTLATIGTYGLVTAVTGGLGTAALFTAQNIYEFKTGQEPTIIRLAKDPIKGVGELAPLAGLGLLDRGIRTRFATEQSIKATTETKGTIATPDIIRDTKLSVELVVNPVEGILHKTKSETTGGIKRTVGIQKTILGEEVLIKNTDLKNLGDNFVFRTEAQQTTNINLVSQTPTKTNTILETTGEGSSFKTTGKTSTETTPIKEVGFYLDDTAILETKKTGTITSKELTKEIKNNFFRYEEQPTNTAINKLISSEGQAVTRFDPYKPVTSKDLATTKPSSSQYGKKSFYDFVALEKKGGSIGYTPKLDYFEALLIKTDKGILSIVKSPYTGAGKTSFMPLLIKEVIIKPSYTKPTTAASTSAGTVGIASGTLEVDIPLKDGTVLKKVIKLAPEIEVTKTKQKTEQVTKTKLKTEQKTEQVNLQKQKTEQATAQKQYTGQTFKGSQIYKTKSLSKVDVRFKSITKASTAQSLRFISLTKQQSKLAQAQSLSQAQAQAQEQAQAQKSVLDLRTKQINLTAQDIAQSTAQKSILSQSLKTSLLQQPIIRKSLQEIIPENKVPFTPLFTTNNNELKKNKGFDVLVRRKGVFKSVGRSSSLSAAVFKGKSITENTAAASFKILGDDIKDDSIKGLLSSRFRKSKKEKGVFIQKKQFRISTGGELFEITKKGQATKKNKRSGFKWV